MASSVKGFYVNRKNNGKILKRILSEISEDVSNISHLSVIEAQKKLAPKIVYDIARRGKFNNYTGAMSYAYGAALVADGEHYSTYQLEDGALGQIKPPSQTAAKNSKGRDIAYLQKPRRHLNTPLYRRYNHRLKRKHVRGRKTKYNLYPTYRYIKRFERLGNNFGRGFHSGSLQLFRKQNTRSRVGNLKARKIRKGSKFERLYYIQVFNASTYAAMVQARGYDVLSGGLIAGRAKYLRHVFRNVCKEDIQRAMHNYVKDYTNIQLKKRSSDLYGRFVRYTADTWD